MPLLPANQLDLREALRDDLALGAGAELDLTPVVLVEREACCPGLAARQLACDRRQAEEDVFRIQWLHAPQREPHAAGLQAFGRGERIGLDHRPALPAQAQRRRL